MQTRRRLSHFLGVLALSAPSTLGCQAVDGTKAPATQPPPTISVAIDPGAADNGGPQPPPISGGTLLVRKDGTTAVAADPDRDRIWIVDLAQMAVLHDVRLPPGDEPGRVVEDASGRIHVALRGGGALLSIDPQTGTVLARRPVCPAPRGLAHEPTQDVLHVACADGRLVTFPSGGGDALRTVRLDGDLRDVVVQGGKLYVSRFRAAELLEVAPDGTLAQRISLPVASLMTPKPFPSAPAVAYRTVAMPGGGVAMLHQRGVLAPLSTMPGGYTEGMGMCPGAGVVEDAVTIVRPGMAPSVAPTLGMIALAVDLAVSPDGTQIAVAAPANPFGTTVSAFPMSALEPPPGGFPCALRTGGSFGPGLQAIAVAFDGQGRIVAQTREPAVIYVAGTPIALPGESVANDGHATFHTPTKAGIACASCHPEGGDDGRVWHFDGLGGRRTQNLRGGVLARTPFHWSGEIADMDQLMTEVFVGRMGGSLSFATSVGALGRWMDAQPALLPPPPADAAAVARGAQIFHDPSVGCATCHGGPQLSNHALVDVGTGGTFKVPSLVAVAYRAPYLHDGCAATLRDRFGGACGGGEKHGQTQHLAAGQLDDLIAFLQSL